MAVTWTYEAPDGDTTVVEVTFTDGTIEHTRTVNAVFVDGVYDADATETRVGEVAAGVEHKIAVGVISIPAEDPEAADEE